MSAQSAWVAAARVSTGRVVVVVAMVVAGRAVLVVVERGTLARVVVGRTAVVVGRSVVDGWAMVVDGATVVVVVASAAVSPPPRTTAVAIPVPIAKVAMTAITIGSGLAMLSTVGAQAGLYKVCLYHFS